MAEILIWNHATWLDLPDLSLPGKFDLFHSWQTAGLLVCAMFVFTLLLTDFFDSMGTMGRGRAGAGLVTKEGSVPRAKVRNVDWTDYEIAIPAFLAIVLMPFTYSITNGIGAGLISYSWIKLSRGKAREVHPLLWVVSALFVLYFLRGVTELMLK